MTELAGYRALEQLVGGGMARVFRAVDERSGRAVAIKVISGQEPEEVERARREVSALATLSHEAIVPYLDAGVTDAGELYLVMPWVAGPTLSARIRRPGVSLAEAVAVIARIAAALGEAHERGLVHRDVKPSNILLPDDDPARAVLIDFGLVRSIGLSGGVTRTGTTVGTPGYMAPEQARGERLLSPAVDVFALGSVLYECACGRPAFSGTQRAAVMTKVLFCDPDPIDGLCPEMAGELRALLAAMMVKDPRTRMTSGVEVARALAQHGPVAAGPRRAAGQVDETPTVATAAQGEVRCLVLAACGVPDDDQPPPDPAALEAISHALGPYEAEPLVLATGCLVVKVGGSARATAERAAWCALALRAALPGWTVIVSALEPNLGSAAEVGTALLSRSVMATMFKKLAADAVAIDPSLVPYLEGAFELGVRPARIVRARS
jgi:hypothetical protein